MFTTIGLTLLRLFKKDGAWAAGYAQRVGRIAVVIVAALLLLVVAKFTYDRSLIERHEAQIANDVLNADRAANEKLEKDQAEFNASQDRLETAATEAAKADPTGAAKPVGPVTKSYYDNLPGAKK